MHACYVEGCPALIEERKLFCEYHWKKIPMTMKYRILECWEEWADAVAVAMRYVCV